MNPYPPWICTALSARSEEHTSELQSQSNLVCRLLLEKKKRPHARHQAHHSHDKYSSRIASPPRHPLPLRRPIDRTPPPPAPESQAHLRALAALLHSQ